MNKIHGHEVMQKVCSLDKKMTRADVVAEVVNAFGANTEYYSCSADGLTADEIISFFESKGKFCFDTGYLALDAGGGC